MIITEFCKNYSETQNPATSLYVSKTVTTTTDKQKQIVIDYEQCCVHEWKIDAYLEGSTQEKAATMYMSIEKTMNVRIKVLASKYRGLGIGTKLVQMAIEIGLRNGCEGKLELTSAGDALGFWNRCGLISLEKDSDKTLIPMFLPANKIEEWKRKIQDNPILSS